MSKFTGRTITEEKPSRVTTILVIFNLAKSNAAVNTATVMAVNY